MLTGLTFVILALRLLLVLTTTTRFGYYHEAPVVLSASPSSGPAAGGTVVSVTSDNVAPTVDLQCAFGSLQRSPATLVDSRTVRCLSPSQTANGSLSFGFEVDPHRRDCLLNGWDDIGLVLRHADKIREFEARRLAEQPWLGKMLGA